LFTDIFMAHFVYIIQSKVDGTFYIGESKDPLDRLEKHNRPHKGYTARKQCWKILYKEEFPSRTEAKKGKAFLKKQKSIEFLINLISKNKEMTDCAGRSLREDENPYQADGRWAEARIDLTDWRGFLPDDDDERRLPCGRRRYP